MKVTADARGRIGCAELFPAGDTFEASVEPDGSIRLIRLAPSNVPVLRARCINGIWMADPRFKPSKETIAEAVRAERDEP
jgi:hypothetical protein